MSLTLNQMQPQQKAIISHNGLQNVPLKLLELGFLEGEIIEMIGTAPLGDPFLILLNQSKIAVGKDVAELVEVELIY